MKEFTSIENILDFAIDEEQKAVDFYAQLAQDAKTEDMKQTFLEFAKEEMSHKARLLEIKTEGAYDLPVEKVADLKISDFMVNVEPSPKMTYQEALVLAMNKEKAAFRLYTKLAERAPNESLKQVFLSLAMEESKHKLRFEIEYDEFVLREN